MSAPDKGRLHFPFAMIAAVLMSIATGFAYERDIHYSATLAMSIAEGWPVDEARVIASAAQGVDENRATIAALEFDVISNQPKVVNGEPFYARGPIHQAQKNFRFHCFSEIGDKYREIEAGVASTVNSREKDAERVVAGDQVPPPRIDSLVAIGVAVHCIQDAHSHNGYGGRCPKNSNDTYPGNCYGHTKDSAKDGFWRVFGGSRTNPDHPAVRDVEVLMRSLDETRRYLREARKLTMSSAAAGAGQIKDKDLARLAAALHNPDSKRLDDDVRMACNHEVIAGWLYEVLPGNGSRLGLTQTKTPASNECVSVFGTAFLPHRLDLGAPLYPRLSVDARVNHLGNRPPYSPANAPYVVVGEKDMADLAVEEVSHQQHSCTRDGCTYSFVVRVSNTGQAQSAAGYILIAVIPINDNRESFGFKAPIERLAPGEKAEVRASTFGPAETDYFVNADIQPPPTAVRDWRDANVRNDSASCAVFDGKLAEKPDSRSGAKCRGMGKPPRLT